jgi:hypothetical protein
MVLEEALWLLKGYRDAREKRGWYAARYGA